MQQQGSNNGGGQPLVLQRQQDLPVVLPVALLPHAATEENQHETVQSEFMMSSISRYKDSGECLSAAEYAKYIVEVACAEEWLLPICRRAGSHKGVVKLCYGSGFETTVIIGNADAGAKPTRLAIGVIVNRSNANISQIEGFPTPLWIPCSESIWCHVVGAKANLGQEEGGNVCIFLRTGDRKFMIPALPEEELGSRRRMIRVWPDPEREEALERMEELQGPRAPAPAPISRAPVARAPIARAPAASAAATSEKAPKTPPAKKDKDKAATKKRSSSTDEQSEEPKKKRSSSTDEQSEEPKKKRAKRDPTRPKQPATVYNLFSHDIRARVKEENPNAEAREVSKLISKQYKKLTDEDKEKYTDVIEADKERYKEEMKVWNAKQESEKAEKEEAKESESSSDEDSVSGSSDEDSGSGSSDGSSSDDDNSSSSSDDSSSSPKDNSNDEEKEETAAEEPKKLPMRAAKKPAKQNGKGSKKPKRGATAYNIFVRENRPRISDAHPNEDSRTITHLVGKAYKNLSEEEKAVYVAMSEEDKVKQATLLAKWEAEHPSDDDGDGKTKKRKKKRAKKDPNEPKRARTAYICFCKEERATVKAANPDASFSEMGTLLGDAYGKLSVGDKAKYVDMAEKDKERYEREMEAYKEKKEGGDRKAETDEAARHEEEEDDDGSKKPAAKPTKSAAATEPSSPKQKKKAKAVAKSTPKRKRSDADDSDKEIPKRKSSHKKKSSEDEASKAAASESNSSSKKKSAKKKKKKGKHRKPESAN